MLVLTLLHKYEDFKQALISSAGVELGMTGNVCLKSPDNKIKASPNKSEFPLMSLEVLSNASTDFLCAIVYSSHTINLHSCKSFAVPDVFDMLHVGVSVPTKFNGNFSAECAVLPPSNKVAAMQDEAKSNAILLWERIVASNKEIKNVFPVPPGAS